MNFHPVIRIPFFQFIPAYCNDIDDITKVVPSQEAIWQLHGGPSYYYVCMQALAHNAREEDCRTPTFERPENGQIPGYVLDWMYRYIRVIQVGMAWGSQYNKK